LEHWFARRSRESRERVRLTSFTNFIHKMAIALKEANETEYGILLLRETN